MCNIQNCIVRIVPSNPCAIPWDGTVSWLSVQNAMSMSSSSSYIQSTEYGVQHFNFKVLCITRRKTVRERHIVNTYVSIPRCAIKLQILLHTPRLPARTERAKNDLTAMFGLLPCCSCMSPENNYKTPYPKDTLRDYIQI